MRVVCPHTDLRPEVATALDATGHPWERIWVGRSEWDYFLRLADLWVDGSGFIVIEHDVVVNPDTLDALEACDGEWCAAPYPYFDGMTCGLGCVKFSDSLVQRLPALILEVGRLSDERHPPGTWCRLDAWTYHVLTKARVTRCEAHTPVGHLNPDKPAHGCVPT